MTVIEANTFLYRRTQQESNHITYGKFFWCDIEDSSNYGRRLHQYETLRPLNLLDTSTKEFRKECKDYIEQNYDEDEWEALFLPFGLADFANTVKVLKSITVNGVEPKLQTLSKDQQQILFHTFDGCMRSSMGALDIPFTVVLQKIYGKEYDGYISPMRMPGMLHGMFHTEVCLFEPDDKSIVWIKSEYSQKGAGDEDEPILYDKDSVVTFGARDPDADTNDYLDATSEPPIIFDTNSVVTFGVSQRGGQKQRPTWWLNVPLVVVVALFAFIGGVTI